MVKVKLNHDKATFDKAHDSDTGYDLTCVGYTLKGTRRAMLDLGVSVEPPEGYYFELVPRSSISKTEFVQHNGVGIIDQDYRGPIMMPVLLWGVTASEEVLHHLVKNYFMNGKPCAQMVLKKKEDMKIEFVNDLSNTTRGEGGFGSTDE